MKTPIVLFRCLILATAALLCTAATVSVVVSDATCVLKAEYTGALDDGPTWVANSEVCEGSCPTSGACGLRNVGTLNQSVYECVCPSGGGNNGCRAQSIYERLSPEDPWVYKGIQCKGSCSAPTPTCDWKDLGASAGTKRWATCKCQ
jgi:hypothetical protein